MVTGKPFPLLEALKRSWTQGSPASLPIPQTSAVNAKGTDDIPEKGSERDRDQKGAQEVRWGESSGGEQLTNKQ